MLKGADAERAFTVYTAQELAAQRIAPMSSGLADGAIRESDCEVQGDWKYSKHGDSEVTIVRYLGNDAEVAVPETIDGLPVTALHDMAFARNRNIEAITVPDSVTSMGMKVFFQCVNLKHARLSDSVGSLDAQTFGGCKSLCDVHLPAKLAVMESRLLFDCPLAEIELPRALERIEPGAVDSHALEHISVAPGNERFTTDGRALFEDGGRVLSCMLRTTQRYVVPDTCVEIAGNAFKEMAELEEIVFGASVERIGAFAFFRTGLRDVVCPPSLKEIGANAFASCGDLASVTLNEGLETLGAQAFSKTGITKISLPASLRNVGRKVFEHCDIDFENEDSFAISAGNDALFTDGKALYRRGEEGATLLCLLLEMASYDIAAGTVEIADDACGRELKLARIGLPEGLKRIGDRAFKACTQLVEAELPESLVSIGEEAFWQTKLSRAYIGANVSSIGPHAFQVAGTSRLHEDRTLTSMEVSKDNERFYFEEGLLIERGEPGDRAFLFVEPHPCVRIPESVYWIDEMAFYHAHLTEVYFHKGVRRVSPRAFMGVDEIERVHVDYPRPVDGFESVTIEFPYQARDMEDFSRSLCIDSDGLFFDFKTYDSMVVHELDQAGVVRMILARFEQPIKLGEAARVYFESAMTRFMNAALRRFAQTGDVATLERMAKQGYLEGQTLDMAIRIATTEEGYEALEYLKGLKNA